MRFPFISLLLLLFCAPLFAQEEEEKITPPRDWKASTGQTLKAVALAYDGTEVTLRDARRRELKLPANKLIAEDIAYLEEFFPPPAPAYDLGQLSDAIEAARDASYYAYIPSTYNPRGSHPLIVHTVSAGATPQSIIRYQKALQEHRWCYIAIIESAQKNEIRDNYSVTERCIRHALKDLPVDRKRIYFSGAHGGGIQALYNLSKFHGAGALVSDARIPPRERISLSSRDVVITTHASSYFRYSAAAVAKKNGARSTKLMYHNDGAALGPSWLIEDALAWLDSRYLLRDYSPDATAKKIAFEDHLLKSMEPYQTLMPYRAYNWTQYMTTKWKLSEQNAEAFKAMNEELGATPKTVQFAQSLDAVSDFALKYYAPLDKDQGPRYNHIDNKAAEAARELRKTYPKSELMEDVLPVISQRTRPDPKKGKPAAE